MQPKLNDLAPAISQRAVLALQGAEYILLNVT
jgi:hypothetical protein